MSAQPDTIAELGAESARELTRKIRVGLEGTYALIIEAFRGRAWTALGYSTWDAYCQGEFGNLSLQPPREDREQVILSMREAGMSVRAIGTATDTPYRTVARQLSKTPVPNGTPEASSVPNEAPVPVTGLDGKTYTPRQPSTSEPKFYDVPLDDALLDMEAEDLGIGVKEERPAPRIVSKPPTVTFPGQKPATAVTNHPGAAVNRPLQGELFSAEQLVKVSRSLVITSSMVADAKLDVEAMSEQDKVMICGDLQDVIDRLNNVLDRLTK